MREQYQKHCRSFVGGVLVLFILVLSFAVFGAVHAQISTKFVIGTRVQTTAILNVRSTPTISALIVGTEALGSLGGVISGPTAADGYIWWKVKYDNGVSGWSVENYLTNAIDTTRPVVSITSPTNNATVSGNAAVLISASDNVGVTKVELYVDGTFETSLGVSPYSYNWETGFVPNGSHKLAAKAYDAKGNVGTSATTTVNIFNTDSTPPNVSIYRPADGQTVSGIVTVSVSANDAMGVAGTNLLVDGTPIGRESASSSHDFTWDSTLVTNTNHALVATARDAAGNVATSTAVTVGVSNVNLAIGDRVQTTVSLNVRSAPSLSGSILEVAFSGAGGVIVAGPTVADGYKWWQIKYDDGAYGWSIGGYLSQSSGQLIAKFSVGDQVETTAALNVRSGPSSTSTIVGTEIKGASGIVFGGPVLAGSYTWWQINYNDGTSGWSVGDYLTKAVQPPPSTKFSIGDNVQTTAVVNVRQAPMVATDTVIGTQPAGAKGIVGSGPYFNNNYWWWNVDYSATTTDGWSIENYLMKVAPPPATTTSPVSISSPLSGSTVSGNMTVNAAVKSGYTITKVEFYLANTIAFIDNTSPYSISVSTLNYANGKFEIYAKAYDTTGGVYMSPTISVNVNNPTKFKVGDRVQATAAVNVRSAPVASGTTITVGGQTISGYVLGTQPLGALGTVSSGPIYADSYGWWLVDYDSPPDGWSIQDYLTKGVVTPTTASTTTGIIDKTPPTVSIISPASGANLSKTVTISTGAVDNVGVARVSFYVDGVYKGIVVASSSPYSFSWDSSSVTNGSHIITAKAYDGSGNLGVSPSVTVNTTNADAIPPKVYINSPTNGQTVSCVVRVSVSATDNVKVADVALSADGAPVGQVVTSSYYSFLWDTNGASNANHVLVATAHDAAGNTGTSAPTTVSVKNPLPSTKLAVGDNVVATSYMNVRSMSSIYAALLGSQNLASIGTVVAGPACGDGYSWWKVNFESGASGWVAENYVEKLSNNLLIDPSFENGGSAWLDSASAGRGTVTSEFEDGTTSEEINVVSSMIRGVSQDARVIPGMSYAAKGWIKTNGVGGLGTRIYLLWFSADPGGYVLPQYLNIYPQSTLVRADMLGTVSGIKGWTNVKALYKAPYTAKFARFLLVTDRDYDNVGSAWLDNLGLYSYGPPPPQDTVPPTVTITSPAKGLSVSTGTINIYAMANDNTAVAKVDIYIDGALAASRASTPYSYAWSTSGIGEGAHTIQATAVDIADNTSSTAITVYVDRTAPTAASGLQARAVSPTQVDLAWTPGNDNIAVAGYKVTRNNINIASAPNGASYSDKSAVGASYYTYAISTYDAAGNAAPPSNQASVITPSPSLSTRFVIGQNVQVTSAATVRATPSLSGTSLGAQSFTQDMTPPSVIMTSPSDGSTITNTVRFAANVTDMGGTQGTVVEGPVYAGGYWWWNVNFNSPPSGWVQESYLRDAEIRKVEFYVEGLMFAVATSSPFAITANISGFPSGGPFGLYAKAYDAAGNVGTSQTVHVSIYNPPLDMTPPTVSFANIADNSVVSSTVQVIASASDNVGVKKVEFYVDAMLKSTKTSTPYSFLWDTAQDGEGMHIIYLMAYDATGNVALSDYLTITVIAPPPS